MKIYFRIIFLASFFVALNSICALGQNKSKTYILYIEQYSDIAKDHQQKYKIPASITLAQGILESGAGMSKFVKESNNHFGIKCHSDWTGKKIYRDDDNKNDCFRKYKSAEDSYKDHSLFLLKPRYSPLFDLDIRDYKAWAKGLQKCGYATDKAYANKLIKIIEDYELYQYDRGVKNKKADNKKDDNSNDSKRKNDNVPGNNRIQQQREIFKTHGLIYVIAKSNDSFDNIAFDLGFKVKNLVKYNEVPEDFPLYKGDIIYLEKKKKKADKPYYEHEVQIGESMHSISQRYGVKVSSLYKLNKKEEEYVPEEGDVLRLR